MATRQSPSDEFGRAFHSRRVLVTGATGFIGWHLCRHLVSLGADVHGLSRSASATTLPDGCRPRAVDLSDLHAVRQAVTSVKPDVVFHLASSVDGRQERELVVPMMQANLVGAVHLALACSEAGGAHVVAVGSADEPLGRQEVAASPYAAAKAAAGAYFQMFHAVYGLPVVMVRPFLTYGPRQARTKLIPYAISMLLQQKAPLVSSGDRVCDFVHVTDVVRGLCRAALVTTQYGRTFDLGSGIGTTVRDLVSTLADLCGTSVRPDYAVTPERRDEPSRIADVATTASALGWTAQWSLRDGLADTVAAFQQGLQVSR